MTQYVVYKDPTIVDFLTVLPQLPEDEREQYEAFTGREFNPMTIAAEFSLGAGPKWCLMADDDLLAVGGFAEIRPGVWQDWLFSTPAAWSETHWMPLTRRARRVMDAMLRGPAHRLQCVSLASRIQAHRWYRTLGLELEGTLRGYGTGGENALMFSRLRKDHG